MIEETFFATEIEQQAQTESGMKDLSRMMGRELCASVLETLKNSIKFRLPDDGMALPKEAFVGLNQLDVYEKYCVNQRMPFESTAIEYPVSKGEEIGLGKFLVLVLHPREEHENRLFGWSFMYMLRQKHWVLSPAMFYIDFKGRVCRSQSVNDHAERLADSLPDKGESLLELSRSCSTRVIGFLAALSCTNAKIENVDSGRLALNKKREKSGKPPFYSYKVLTIAQNGFGGGGDGTSGRSPRVHLRRGHIRRLKNKTVWVNASVVGDKSKGFAHKDYAVRGFSELSHAPH